VNKFDGVVTTIGEAGISDLWRIEPVFALQKTFTKFYKGAPNDINR
jgi:hypothetical protein